MPSLLSGYAYDIFISYRHNDNRSGWVTEFVTALQEELAATIKDPISVYYDTNPHDGLLETHSVDKSLEGKLKCLIFIPILSQTYCDPKSFAWRYEFCAFNSLAKEDSFGRDIRLSTGNVASRILPIKIHELDNDDKTVIEGELGGVLRAIDFIYKEAGVNRPLKPADSKNDNQNRTDYRNQLNKAANAIKEIIYSLKNPAANSTSIIGNQQPVTGDQDFSHRGKSYTPVFLLSIVAIAIASYFYYQSNRDAPATTNEASVAVLPFVDLTPGSDMGYLGDGIADEIINSLTTISGLKVAGRTSSFQFKGEKVDLRMVGERLHVIYVLEGSIQKYEDNFRVTAQLIRTSDNFHAWSQRFDLKEVNIFKIQDIIAAAIVEKLRITLTSSEIDHFTKKEISQQAYTEYLKGVYQYNSGNLRQAIPFLKRAIQLDSGYAPSYAFIGLSKGHLMNLAIGRPHPDSIRNAIRYATRATQLDPALPEGYSALALIAWMNQRDFSRSREFFEKSIELNPSSSLIRNRYAYFLTWMGDFAKASAMNRKAIQLDPVDWNSYVLLFDSAYYNSDPLAGSRILAEYKRIFGANQRWLRMTLRLKYINGNHKDFLHFYDSVVNTGFSINAADLSLLARSWIKSGEHEKGDSLKAQLIRRTAVPDKLSCFAVALIYAVEKKPDSCFHYLSLAAERFETGAIMLKIEPDLAPCHNDPRYKSLYTFMGFDKY